MKYCYSTRDLTTANVLIDDETQFSGALVLGKCSNLLEDFGTDLLVFKKSLTAIIPEKSVNYLATVSWMDIILRK